MSESVSFTPLVVTAETLQILSKEKKYADLLALYMAYVEITSWQGTKSIKAATTFMTQRLHWGKDKVIDTKKKLIELGLIESSSRKDAKTGKVTGHYILVKYIINPHSFSPEGGFDQRVVLEDTSTTNLQLSTTNEQQDTSASQTALPEQAEGQAQKSVSRDLTEDIFTSLVSILHPGQLLIFTPGRQSKIKQRLKHFPDETIYEAAKNLMKSDWHIGKNPGNKKYASFDFLMRNDEMVEKWANETPTKEAPRSAF